MTSIVIIYKIGFGARHYDFEIHESCLQFGFQPISYSKKPGKDRSAGIRTERVSYV
jgi:hypothetical protein